MYVSLARARLELGWDWHSISNNIALFIYLLLLLLLLLLFIYFFCIHLSPAHLKSLFFKLKMKIAKSQRLYFFGENKSPYFFPKEIP